MIFTHTLKNRKRNSRADFSGEFIPQARKRDKNRVLKSISVSSPVKIPVIIDEGGMKELEERSWPQMFDKFEAEN